MSYPTNPYYSDLIQRFGAATFQSIIAQQDASVERDLAVDRNATVGGALDVSGAARFRGDLDVSGDATVGGRLDVSGGTWLRADLDVSGDAAFDGSLSLAGSLDVSGDATVDGSFTVAGSVYLLGELTTGGALDMSGFRITSMAEPTDASDAVTKNYVDSAVGGAGTGIVGITYSAATDTTTVDNCLNVAGNMDVSRVGYFKRGVVSQDVGNNITEGLGSGSEFLVIRSNMNGGGAGMGIWGERSSNTNHHMLLKTLFGGTEIERVRITNSGTVGINTSAPDSNYRLDVSGPARVLGQLDASSVAATTYYGTADPTPADTYITISNDQIEMGTAGSTSFTFESNSGVVQTIDTPNTMNLSTGGNNFLVGNGTTSTMTIPVDEVFFNGLPKLDTGLLFTPGTWTVDSNTNSFEVSKGGTKYLSVGSVLTDVSRAAMLGSVNAYTGAFITVDVSNSITVQRGDIKILNGTLYASGADVAIRAQTGNVTLNQGDLILTNGDITCGGNLLVDGSANVGGPLTVDGSMGVGIANPVHSLHVKSSTNAIVMSEADSTAVPSQCGFAFGSGEYWGIVQDETLGSSDMYIAYGATDASFNQTNIASLQKFVTVRTGGTVGIGTTSPDANYILDVDGSLNVAGTLDVDGSMSVGGDLAFGATTRQMVNLVNDDYGIGVQASTLYFRTGNGGGMAFYKGGVHAASGAGAGGTELMTLSTDGSLNVAGGLDVGGRLNVVGDTQGSHSLIVTRNVPHSAYEATTFLYMSNTNGSDGYVGMTDSTLFGEYISFGFGNNGPVARIAPDGTYINFTGQHHNYGVDETIDLSLVGFIVSSTGSYRNQMADDDEANKFSITINESLPIVDLSKRANDKRVFGVISSKDDTGTTRERAFGNFVSVHQQESLDRPLTINSLGEGALWVCDYGGALENGDYVTSSPIPGLGMLQADDLLHNYTVAKVTMDCSFAGEMVPKKRLRTTTDASGNEQPVINDDGVFQYEPELDASGQPVMVEKYERRFVAVLADRFEIYLDEARTQLHYAHAFDFAGGDAAQQACVGNTYVMAFVGCTYHCG